MGFAPVHEIAIEAALYQIAALGDVRNGSIFPVGQPTAQRPVYDQDGSLETARTDFPSRMSGLCLQTVE